jgi:hypothetical protein
MESKNGWLFFADGSIPTQEDARMFLEFAKNIANLLFSMLTN